MSFFNAVDPKCEEMKSGNPVDMKIVPRTADIGNFEVHRALPSREVRMVGPFIFWDQMGPGEFISGQGVDVRPHPHIGLSTVTYLFSGTLDHKDSLGSDQRITPGDVNVMTAGQGITHSERTGAEIRQNPSNLFGIQSWLALPKTQEERDPGFEHIVKAALPEMEYQGVKARVIMGELFGKSSPVKTFSDTLYLDVVLDEGAIFEVPQQTEERGLYPLDGEIEIAGIVYAPMQLLVLHPGDAVVVKALKKTRMMVMGGAVMDGERHIWWNFVSSSKERIKQAMADWQNGKFPGVPGDEEFIPLPAA